MGKEREKEEGGKEERAYKARLGGVRARAALEERERGGEVVDHDEVGVEVDDLLW